MNRTFATLTKYSKLKKTEILSDKILQLLEGHSGGTVMAAIIPILINAHINVNIENDGTICIPCTNAGLTELIQTIRKLHDDLTDGIPTSSGHK